MELQNFNLKLTYIILILCRGQKSANHIVPTTLRLSGFEMRYKIHYFKYLHHNCIEYKLVIIIAHKMKCNKIN